MVQQIIKFAGETVQKAKSIFFDDPFLLYKKEKHLLNQPFFFEPSSEASNGKGILLIHGWTSTPYELRRLGKYLNENGYTVLGIQLSGHGTVPMDLESVKWQAWIEDTRKGCDKLKETCSKVFVAGSSIGSAVTMQFAKENPEIAGLVLMASPYKLKLEKFIVLFARIMKFFGKKYNKKFYPPTFGSRQTITRLTSYQTYSINSALETFELVKKARKNLEKITQPCLILQTTHDHIVTKDSMDKIYEKIGSKIKRKKYIPKAYHTFIADIRSEYVFKDILDFLNNN